MFNSGIMLRLGKTVNIHRQYEECRLTFGCPANWIRYAKHDATGIADEYEAILGHVSRSDERLSQICDDGAPLNSSNSLWETDDSNNNELIFVRYIYSCLTPTICFYSRKIKEEVIKLEQEIGHEINSYEIDMKPYLDSLGLDVNDCSFLVVRFPGKLWQELKMQIPKELKSTDVAINIDDFKIEDPLCIRYVDYSLDIEKEFFQENVHSYSPIFTKRPKYKDQCEARIFIPNVYFTTYPLIEDKEYDIKNFEFSVSLPNMHEYISEVPASGKHKMIFYAFDEKRENYHVRME